MNHELTDPPATKSQKVLGPFLTGMTLYSLTIIVAAVIINGIYEAYHPENYSGKFFFRFIMASWPASLFFYRDFARRKKRALGIGGIVAATSLLGLSGYCLYFISTMSITLGF